MLTLMYILLVGTSVASAQNPPPWTFIQSSYYDNHGNGLACTASGGCVGSSGSNCAVSANTCAPNMRQVIKSGDVLVAYSEIYNPTGVNTTLSSISGETSLSCPICQSSVFGVTQNIRLVPLTRGGHLTLPARFRRPVMAIRAVA